MTDIIERLARDSGLAHIPGWVHQGQGKENLERFAALVAEECAKVAENSGLTHPVRIATAIRNLFSDPAAKPGKE